MDARFLKSRGHVDQSDACLQRMPSYPDNSYPEDKPDAKTPKSNPKINYRISVNLYGRVQTT